MKKITLLLIVISSGLIACSDNAPGIQNTINGDYNVDVHYHHSWVVSSNNYGLVIDTNYTTTFKIVQLSNDSIDVQFSEYNGNQTSFTLGRINESSNDTLLYTTPYYGYDGGYSGAKLEFYKNASKLYFYAPQRTNPSGGGLNKYYDIKSL